jgi:pyruvate-ferredoxin/flavodoxin oxidoreductase
MQRKMVPYDGNSAVAYVAHATNEVCAIYPITPSSGMGEVADEFSAGGVKNIWGTVPKVSELQSEAGASGAVHGALSAGALTTTFTASQGLLLMIPNMHKIAGELLPTVFHVSARSIACQALSIFGDHSDVMDTRATGFALLSSASIQEAMDFALISQEATLESRIPFLHFFDGFRVSHEIQKIEEITHDDMRAMIDDKLVAAHKARSMSPDKPILRGTSQNPDVYFQGRETVNKFYTACPSIVQKVMDKYAKIVGRKYNLFDYYGDPNAERLLILMGSGCETAHETVNYLNSKGEKVGLIKVRLYRPFDRDAFLSQIPASIKKIAVLDRTKEPGSLGEPLYQDTVTAISEGMALGKTKFKSMPLMIGGRYGLSSKEFTPAMVKAVFDELNKGTPKGHFTVGIVDDVTKMNLDYDPSFEIEGDVYRAMFWGLGSDGTIGANKNSIKIIADNTDNYTQGYFVYDSKKAGARTVSHLRFGKNQIQKPYLVSAANFLACHNFSFCEKYDMLRDLVPSGIFLLNSPYGKDEVWDKLPYEMQKQIIDRKVKFYVIDAVKIAEELGLGARINTIMQTSFFRISKVIDDKLAINEIKDAIKKTYGSKGEKVVEMNVKAVDMAINETFEVKVPSQPTSKLKMPPTVPTDSPEFVQGTIAKIIKQEGDTVTVAEMPADGTWPTATTQYEKRNIAVKIPQWNTETCIQCGQCSLVCPHATIRMKAYKPEFLKNAPASFKSAEAKGPAFKGMKYTLQIAPEDCTGCGTCVYNCPAKDKEAIKMVPQIPLRESERENYSFFLSLPETDESLFKRDTIKGSQFVRPLFEYSGACAGCGETAYIKLMTQLYGDRAIIANATGCSSIYGGNLPTTPYATRSDGRGPTWNNSLFEDTAEVAYGMRISVNKQKDSAYELADRIIAKTSDSKLKTLLSEIKAHDQSNQIAIEALRGKISELKKILVSSKDEDLHKLLTVADYFVKKSVWGIGGDGWAYDIGYGGLDHVLASGENVNLMVLDTEVYSNTGGQASKSTPLGAVARFAMGGKPIKKKDLGLIAMTYGYIYVAQIALGSNPTQAVKAFTEAEAYNGPSLIICYAHCINQGIDMTEGLGQHEKAVNCGHWPIYRFNPDLVKQGKNPLQLDSKQPSIPISDYMKSENRFRVLFKSHPEAAERLMKEAQEASDRKWQFYSQMAKMDYSPVKKA